MKKRKSFLVDIDHLANLTRLKISSKEKQLLKRQLEKTIAYVKILNQLKTEKVRPAHQTTGLENISRQDIPQKNLTNKEALANAPTKKQGYFVTRRIKWE